MKLLRNRWVSACLLTGVLLTSTSQAWADNIPPSSSTSGAPSVPTPAARTGESFASSCATGEIEPLVSPGPLEAARKNLLDKIHQAKSEGIGIANYMMVYTSLEDSVKAGQTEAQLRPRVDSLTRALKDQLDKRKILKTQRPIPPAGSQISATQAPTAQGSQDMSKLKEALGGSGGKDPSALIDKIKAKFGGDVPDIPDSIKDKLPKDILDKLGK